MNFYKRFIGDIQKKTGHLSLAEFGAYDRLLDHYYSTEQPLPPDVDSCCRIARAMVKDERKAVESVLKQFFTLTEAGYTQSRADEMIAEAKPKITANQTNGAKGGRPRKDKTATQEKPTGFLDETQDEPNENLSQSQSQITTSLRSVVERASPQSGSRLPPDWTLPDDWSAWAAQERPDIDPSETAKGFADYWHGVAGAKGRKADWFATWRNWVRREHPKSRPMATQSQPMSFAERDEMARRKRWEEMTGRKWSDSEGEVIEVSAVGGESQELLQ